MILEWYICKYVYDHYYIEKPLQFIGNPRYGKEAQMIGKLGVGIQFNVGQISVRKQIHSIRNPRYGKVYRMLVDPVLGSNYRTDYFQPQVCLAIPSYLEPQVWFAIPSYLECQVWLAIPSYLEPQVWLVIPSYQEPLYGQQLQAIGRIQFCKTIR